MKKEIIKGKALSLALLLSCVVILPGCSQLNWLKDKLGMGNHKHSASCGHMGGHMGGHDEKTDDEELGKGTELASLGGKRIVSEESFKRDFEQLLDANPQLKQVLPFMPDAEYNFLQGLVSQEVVDRYVADNGLDQTPEYKKEEAQMMRSVRRMLNTNYFSKAYPTEVSDADVRAYYEENKETMPALLVSQGGTKAKGVEFDKEADAVAFLEKAKGNNFDKAVKESGLAAKMQDFNLVHDKSLGVNAEVRKAIASMKTFPATQMVKLKDGKAWVVNATEAKKPQYRSLDEVQADLKQHIEKEKRMAMFEKEVNRLKDEYKVVVNDEYFENKRKEQQLAQEKQMQEMTKKQEKMAGADKEAHKAEPKNAAPTKTA